MEELERAIAEKDCEKVLELFDDYIEGVEDEGELKATLKKLEELAADCWSYDLAHEVAHVYAHLGEEERLFNAYRNITERARGSDRYAEALYYLADAYEHFGFYEEALKTFEELYKIEKSAGERKEEALTLARMALVHEELDDLEEAIKKMEAASALFKELGDDLNFTITLVDLAHFYHSSGDDERAMRLIEEVLRNPRDTEVEVNALLIRADVKLENGQYREGFKDIAVAMVKAFETDEELFIFVLDTMKHHVETLITEKNYAPVYENMDLFVEAFDEHEDYARFFRAIAELARLKEGDEAAKGRFDELYAGVEDNDLRALLDELKGIGTTFLNIGL